MSIKCDLKNRFIFLGGDIDEDSASEICGFLIQLIMSDNAGESSTKNFIRKPIHFFINSVGGNLYDSYAIADIIQFSKTPIYTYAIGKTLSGGFTILVSGHKRYAYPNSRLMFHQINVICNKYTPMSIVTNKHKLNMYDNDHLFDFMRSKTNIPDEIFDKVRNDPYEYYMTPQEALDFNCIDKIILDTNWEM